MTYANRPGLPLQARGNALISPLLAAGTPSVQPSAPQMQGNTLGWSSNHWPNAGAPSQTPSTPQQPPQGMPQQPNTPGNSLGGFWDWLERLRQQYQGQMPQTPQSPTGTDDPNRGGYVKTRNPYQGW